MKTKYLLLLLLILASFNPLSANNENIDNKLNEKTNREKSIISDIDINLTTTVYPSSIIPKADATAAPYNSLNLEIGLSKLKLFGYAQTWYTWQNSQGKNSNGLNVQRIILMADAELTSRISFFMMYDAVRSELHEYYAQFKFSPQLKLRVGQYKQPFTMESVLSPTYMSTIFYDPSILYLAGIANDPLMGNGVARDAGIMFTGDFLNCGNRYLFNYSIGVFNGPGMNRRENNNQKDIIGMLMYKPLSNILLESSFLLGTGHAQMDSHVSNISQGKNYSRKRWNLGIEAKFSPIYLRSEFIIGRDGKTDNMGGYVNLEYKMFKGFDIILNYDYLNKNTSLNKQKQKFIYDNWKEINTINTYTAGAQWWFHKRCRLSGQYVYTHPVEGAIRKEFISQLQIVF